MSNPILSAQIVAAWREATHPLSKERALEIANEILTGRERAQFAQWFEINGEAAIRRLGG